MQSSNRKRKRPQESDDSEDADAPRIVQWEDDDYDELGATTDQDDEQDDGALRPVKSRKMKNTVTIEDELETLPLGTLRKAQRLITQVETDDSESEQSDEESEEETVHSPDKASTSIARSGKEKKTPSKRANKHAPTEVTSKRPASRKRTVVEATRIQSRDPRFSLTSGEFDPKAFQQHYGFLSEKHKTELTSLRDNLKRARRMLSSSPRDLRAEREREVERLELAVKRGESLVNRDRAVKVEQEALNMVKREERERRNQGKGVWYLKDAEKKKLLLKARYEALATEGGHRAVKKAITKREKKIGQKEKKSRPKPQAFQRVGEDTRRRG